MMVNERFMRVRMSLKIFRAVFARGRYAPELESKYQISPGFGMNEQWLKTARGGGEVFSKIPGEKIRRMMDLFSELILKFQDYGLLQTDSI